MDGCLHNFKGMGKASGFTTKFGGMWVFLIAFFHRNPTLYRHRDRRRPRHVADDRRLDRTGAQPDDRTHPRRRHSRQATRGAIRPQAAADAAADDSCPTTPRPRRARASDRRAVERAPGTIYRVLAE